MSHINLLAPHNLVCFCEKSLDPQAMNAIIKKNKDVGLSDPALEENLKAGNYENVLVSLWSERDRTRRLEWLQTKSNELHPILMFELAIAEFSALPTVETVHLVSIPLIKAASFRVAQDAQCSTDASVKNGDASQRMSMTYVERLKNRFQALLKCPLESILNEQQNERMTAIKEKVLETAKLSLSNSLPPPDWVGWHGMSVFRSGAPKMHAASEYKQIRDAYANKAIEQILASQSNPPVEKKETVQL